MHVVSADAHRRPDVHRRPDPRPALARRQRPLPPHAVVIGAGLHGLAAAHALGNHLERVTLLEREDLPDRVASRTCGPPSRYLGALRRVLDCPQVVVRAGLEAVGLALASGRACGVEVRPREGAPRCPSLAILADLVVDARGVPLARATPRPDGLLVVGPAATAGRPSGISAELAAGVLGRCLAEHLIDHPDLTGFSPTAQRALAHLGAGAPRAER